MSDDRAFLNSLLAMPDDAAPWLVYADWLDERGDARGEYIRLVQGLATKPDAAIRKRLNAVRPTLPRDWLAVVEQPKLLRANPTPYETEWSGVGLGDVRLADGTYKASEYQTLPAVPVEWVLNFEEWLSSRTVNPPGRRTAGRALARLANTAEKVGLPLPTAFEKFFLAQHYRGFARSPTAGSFQLAGRPVPAPGDTDACLVRFYTERAAVDWHLYLTPARDSCVVASVEVVCSSQIEYPSEIGKFWFCAPSFEEFVVRTWIENVAWYALHPQDAGENERRWASAPEVRAYLDHYRNGTGS